MMLRERWRVVAVLGIGLAVTAVLAPGQSAAHKPKAVQPAQGVPPDQAVEPDISTQLPEGQQEAFPEPHPAPPTPPVETPAPPTPVEERAAEPAGPAPAPVIQTVKAAPEEPPAVPANTPEGRKLQKETATLLQLARDLKDEIAKAGNNTLSLVALRKVDEIEKMSKDLKQEMSKQEQPAVGK